MKKIKKSIFITLISVVILFTFIIIPVHAEEKTYGYSQIADLIIDELDEERSSTGYRGFYPVFSGATAVVCVDGWNCGYIDMTGKLIIPAEYTPMSGNFIGDYAAVDKSWTLGNNSIYRRRYGLIDREGNVVLPFEYAGILAYNGNYFNEYGLVIVVIYVNYNIEKYGVVDKGNNIVIPFEYEYIRQFIDGYAKAKKDGKELLLDIYGNEHDITLSDADSDKIIIDWKDGKYGIINGAGDIILPYEYSSVWHIRDSLYSVGNYDEGFFVIDITSGKIIAESSDSISYYEEANLLVLNHGDSYYEWDFNSVNRKHPQFGAINLTSGEVIIPFEYSFFGGINGGAIPVVKDGKAGIIDIENNTIMPFIYDGDAIFRYGNGAYEIRGEEYFIVIDGDYNETYRTESYILSDRGDYLIFSDRSSVEYNQGLLHSYGSYNHGIVDIYGNIIIPMEYFSIDLIADKYFICYSGYDDAYSIFDLSGNQISKDKYSSSVVYLEELDRFIVTNRCTSIYGYVSGVIDDEGNYIIPLKYDIQGEYHDIRGTVIIHDLETNKYGYFNRFTCEIIVPTIFDYACGISDDGRAVVKQDGQWKIILIDEVASKHKIGDVMGDILYSDIAAYIDGHALPTTSTEGRTLISAEDLANYGFIVVWDAGSRTLRIQRDKRAVVNPLPVTKNTEIPGTFMCNYFYTDIKTYLSGEQIESYCIDGITMIDFELLAKYGNITWDENASAILLVTE